MNYRVIPCSLIVQIIVVACNNWKQTNAFLFSLRCLETSEERCGFLNFGFRMHTGTRGQADACTDSCSYFPLFSPSLNCGGCTIPSTVKYNIYIDSPRIPSGDRFYFDQARAKLESAVTQDIPDVNSSRIQRNGVMIREGCNFPDVIDDLFICAFYTTVDGPYGVAGFAAPFAMRPDAGRQTIAGPMGFDTADLTFLKDNDSFSDVILHEMLHILGMGTRWGRGFTPYDIVDQNCNYGGAEANSVYRSLTGCSAVPLEKVTNQNGELACFHWSESCFGNEVMSHGVNVGNALPLSRITLASLKDLNYTVDYAKADFFPAKFDCCGSRRKDQEATDEGLSEYGLQVAVDFGTSILKDLNKGDKNTCDITSDAQRVSVLYIENDKLYTVMVEAR